jgi:hypothetical protein
MLSISTNSNKIPNCHPLKELWIVLSLEFVEIPSESSLDMIATIYMQQRDLKMVKKLKRGQN